MRKSRIAALSTHAAAVRQDAFGTVDPPFDSALAAAKWLKTESARGRTPDYATKRAAAAELQLQLHRRVARASPKLPIGVAISVGLTVDRLAYADVAAGAAGVVEATTARLVLLSAAARRIAEYAGCLEWCATAYLLTGAPIPAGRISGQRWVSNEIGNAVYTTSSETNNAQLEAHLRQLKRPRDVALLRFAAELELVDAPTRASGVRGGQDRGVGKYWKAFNEAWNARYPDWAFKSWIGLRKRYEALVADLPPGVGING